MRTGAGQCQQGLRPGLLPAVRGRRKRELLHVGGGVGAWNRRAGGRVRAWQALGLTAGSVVDPDTLRNLFTKRIHPVSGEVLGRKPHEFKNLDDEIKAEVDATHGRGTGRDADAGTSAGTDIARRYLVGLRIQPNWLEPCQEVEIHAEGIGQVSKHETDHSDAEEGRDGARIAFEIACEATVADPREGALDDPAFGKTTKRWRLVRLTDLHPPFAGGCNIGLRRRP